MIKTIYLILCLICATSVFGQDCPDVEVEAPCSLPFLANIISLQPQYICLDANGNVTIGIRNVATGSASHIDVCLPDQVVGSAQNIVLNGDDYTDHFWNLHFDPSGCWLYQEISVTYAYYQSCENGQNIPVGIATYSYFVSRSPICSFDVNIQAPCVGNIASVQMDCYNELVDYTYNFGDGTGTTNLPVHTYEAAGTYTITVTAEYGNVCAASSCSQQITIYDAAEITATGLNPVCPGGTTPVSLSSSIGFGTINWTNGGSGITQSLGPGSYTVFATDVYGCAMQPLTFEVPMINVPDFGILTPSPLCTGGSVQLTTSPATVVQWSGPGGFSGSGTSVSVSSPGSYTASANIQGCSVQHSVNVVNAASPSISGSTSFCMGNQTQLSVDGTNVTWSNGTTGNSSNFSTPGLVSAQGVFDGCPFNATLTLVEIQPPVFTLTLDADSICPGSSTILNINITTAYDAITIDGQAINQTFASVGVGLHTVVVSNGICDVSQTVTVHEKNLPQLLITGLNNACPLVPITFTTSLNSNTISDVVWNTGDTGYLMVYTGGSMTISCTGIVDFCPVTATKIFTRHPDPSADVTGIPVICGEGNAASLSATGISSFGLTYEWSSGATPFEANNFVYEEGWIYCTITDVQFGCQSTDSVYVSFHDQPAPPILDSDNILVCPETSGTFNVTDASIGNFLWYADNGSLLAEGSSLTIMEPTTGYVVTTDGVCLSEPVSFSLGNYPSSTFDVVGYEFFCPNNFNELSATNPNLTYTWNGVPGGMTYDIVGPGLLTVEGTNEFGCVFTVIIEIFTAAAPNAQAITNTTEVCPEQFATLALFSDQDNIGFWLNGNEVEQNTMVPAGAYQITAINDSTNCASLPQVIVIASLLPTPINITTDTLLCPGTVTTINANCFLCTDYNWSNGSQNASTIGGPGYYVVSAISTNGCPTFAQVEILLDDFAMNTNSSSLAVCNPDDSVQVSLTFNQTPSYVTINNAPVSEMDFELGIGTYIIQASNSNGCPVSDTLGVYYANDFVYTIELDTLRTCEGLLASIELNISIDEGFISVNWNDGNSDLIEITSNTIQFEHLFNVPSDYLIEFVIEHDGCLTTDSLQMPVPEYLYGEIEVEVNEPITFVWGIAPVINVNVNEAVDYWEVPGTHISGTSDSTFSYYPKTSGYLNFVATDKAGCLDTASTLILYYDPTLQNTLIVSNVEENNCFILKDYDFSGVTEFDLRIYDRWGIEVAVITDWKQHFCIDPDWELQDVVNYRLTLHRSDSYVKYYDGHLNLLPDQR